MLKTTRLLEKLASKVLRANNDKVINGGSRANKTVINSFKKSRNLIYVPNIGAIGELTFLTTNAKKTFNRLSQAFIEVFIF